MTRNEECVLWVWVCERERERENKGANTLEFEMGKSVGFGFMK